MASINRTPVLVTGAGPAGLVLALSLAQNAIPVRIIEKDTTYHVGTRGAGIMPRSLELLKTLGLIDKVNQRRGMTAPPMHFYKLPGGREVVNSIPSIMEQVDTTPARPFNSLYFVSQAVLEEILRDELKKYGCFVEMGKELVGLGQDGNSVIADVRLASSGYTESIRASYLVGADGAKGVVRKLLNLRLLGNTMDADGMVVANAVVDNLSTEAWHVWKNPDSLFFSFRPYERETKKFMIVITGKHKDLESYCSPGGIKSLLATHADREDIVFGEFEWLSYFKPNMRVVDTFSQGRVFLAGDAAHVHSPHGGQGLNTSIQDSFNLAWKIALVHKQLSPPALLDSYNAERLPVITEMLRQVIGLYKQHQDMKGAPSAASRSKELFMLDINYRWSPIIVEQRSPNHSGSAAPAEELKAHSYVGWDDTLCAGDRAPDAPGLEITPSGTKASIFDLLTPTHHTVLVFTTNEDTQKATEILRAVDSSTAKDVIRSFVISKKPLITNLSITEFNIQSFILDSDGHAHASYQVQDENFVVVVIRPDGFIGAMLKDVEGFNNYLGLVFV